MTTDLKRAQEKGERKHEAERYKDEGDAQGHKLKKSKSDRKRRSAAKKQKVNK